MNGPARRAGLPTWVAPAAVALVAALAVGRLVVGTSGAALAAGAAGVAVVTLVGRRPAVAALGGAVAVILVSLWAVLGSATLDGLPTPTTLRSARTALSVAHRAFVAGHLPLPHGAGTTLVATLTAGVVALAVRLVGFRWAGGAVVASGGVVAASTVADPTVGAGLLAVVLGLAAVPLLSGPGIRDPARTLLVVLASVLAVVAAVTSSTIRSGDTGATTTEAQIPVTAASLTTDLDGIVRRDATAVLFRAHAPFPTYWQVVLLTTYRDGVWAPGPTSTAGAGAGGGARAFTAQVALVAFHGPLLPAPPDPISGGGGATVTGSGTVVAEGAVRSYSVRARVPTAVADTAASAGSAADTALPPVPARITTLAIGLTAGRSGVLDKAEAIVDYLRSGAFHYTAAPPPAPPGTDPVVGFLFDTRRGSCQQFASAFAVLARAAGLPTRVAVGFTTGRDTGGQVTVRGVDAHAWPEVDLDGRWVSFEPTPSLPAGESLPAGVLGPAALGPAATPVPVTLPTTPITVPHLTPPTPGAPHPQPGPAPGVGPWVWVLVAVLLGLLLIAGAVVAGRLVRRRRPSARRVVGAWHRADGALRRAGCPRPPSVTPRSHLGRVLAGEPGADSRAAAGRAAARRTGARRAAARELGSVALLLEAATFGGAEVTADDALAAERAVRRGRAALRRCRPLT